MWVIPGGSLSLLRGEEERLCGRDYRRREPRGHQSGYKVNKNVEVLEKVLEVLEEEKRSFYALINQNDFRIEEINSYLKDLSKKEDEDFKVFSPRNVENTHREQIEADVYEKKKYEEENAEYQKKIDFLKSLIDRVNIVIENLQTDINFSGISEKEEVKIKEEREVSKESIIEEKEKKNCILDSNSPGKIILVGF